MKESVIFFDFPLNITKTRQKHKQKNKAKQWVINNTSLTTLLQVNCFIDSPTTCFS